MDDKLIDELSEIKSQIQETTIKKRTCENQIKDLEEEREKLSKKCKDEFDLDILDLQEVLEDMDKEINEKMEKLRKLML